MQCIAQLMRSKRVTMRRSAKSCEKAFIYSSGFCLRSASFPLRLLLLLGELPAQSWTCCRRGFKSSLKIILFAALAAVLMPTGLSFQTATPCPSQYFMNGNSANRRGAVTSPVWNHKASNGQDGGTTVVVRGMQEPITDSRRMTTIAATTATAGAVAATKPATNSPQSMRKVMGLCWGLLLATGFRAAACRFCTAIDRCSSDAHRSKFLMSSSGCKVLVL